MSKLKEVLARVDADIDAALDRLFEVLRIKSISTDPAYAKDVKACAEWHVADLASIGFTAAAHATPGHPIVVAHDRSTPGPTALFYGHYDVQPVDPLERWDRDPFDPAIETREDGTKLIRARGAADDKGQLMTFVEACRAWKAVTGSLPIGVTILLEGEEETGGINLPPFMKAHAGELRADIGLICDTNMWNPTTPAIQTMLRGMVTEEVIIRAADRDLHSGFYGSAAANPNRILARILADLHDDSGRVTIPGFYDGVPELPESLRAQWNSLDFDASAFLGAIGLSVPAGERDRTVLEMVWSRPTAEINGMGGGYQGNGFKTVIPPWPRRRCRSAWCSTRTRRRSGRRSAPSSRRASRPTAASSSSATARAARSASPTRPRPSRRRRRRCPTSGARTRRSSAAAAPFP